MSKNIKGAIPKWRFLEFKGNGDWERKKLGKMAFIVNDKIAIEKLNAETYISTENMLPNFAGVSTASQLPQTGNFTKFKAGDILVSNIRPYLKKVWRSNKTGGASNDVIVFRSNSDIDSNFLEFILKNELFINYVMKNAKGLKMPRGDKESMLIYPVYIPPYPTFSEQQKIADCLSSIDDLISAEEKKLSLLNDYKKGWMQKLFPAEGKTVPEWRFPEFQDSEEWAQKKLDEIGKFIRGFSYSSQDTTYDKTKLLVIRSNNIVPMGKTDYINNLRYVNKKCSEEQNLVFGDITICMANGSSNLIGKSSFYDGGYPGDITVGAFCGIFRSPLPIVRYLFQTNQYNRELQRVSQGGDGAIANLKEIDIKNIEFLLPTLTEEQQKIAGFLSGIDDLITRQTDRIEALKQHKKALMQGLFPSIEEVCK